MGIVILHNTSVRWEYLLIVSAFAETAVMHNGNSTKRTREHLEPLQRTTPLIGNDKSVLAVY